MDMATGNEPKFNNVFSPPTFVIQPTQKGREPTLGELLNVWSGLHSRRQATETMLREYISDSLEAYFRGMIANCAAKIYLPSYPRSSWAIPANLKSLLSQSLKNRIVFVDRRKCIWKSVIAYLQPLNGVCDNQAIELLAWRLYQLVLATRNDCETFLEPDNVVLKIMKMKETTSLSKEGLARLAKLEGIFRCYSFKEEIPAFVFSTTVGRYSISKRIEEILEDSYFLEASFLRRFFSIESNVASVKRKLRRLLHAIVKERTWAKGILAVGAQSALIPQKSFEFLEKLVNVIPELNKANFGPMLLPASERAKLWESTQYPFFVEAYPKPDGEWRVSILVNTPISARISNGTREGGNT